MNKEITFEDAVKFVNDNEDNKDGTPFGNEEDEKDIDATLLEDLDEEPEDKEEPAEEEENLDSTDDTADWKTLYEQTAYQSDRMQDYVASLQARIDELQASTKAPAEVPKQDKKPSIETDPELKDMLEYYPELVNPVQKLIDAKLAEREAAINTHIDDVIKQHISPVAQQLQQTEAQAHRAAIVQAHPDIESIIKSGKMDQWIDSLASYQKTGAQYVYKYGSAPDVINLIDSYKASINTDTPAKKQAKGMPAKEQINPIQTQTNDDTVQRVMDSMYVKSDNFTPDVSGKKVKLEDLDPKQLFNYYAKQVMEENKY